MSRRPKVQLTFPEEHKSKRGRKKGKSYPIAKPEDIKLKQLMENAAKASREIDQKDIEVDDDDQLVINSNLINLSGSNVTADELKVLQSKLDEESKQYQNQIAELKKLLDETSKSKIEESSKLEKALKDEIASLKTELKTLEAKKANEFKEAVKEVKKAAEINVAKKIRMAGLRL